MKIGFFTDTYFPQISGVATSIQTLKVELEKMGHDVYIFTTTDPRAVDDEDETIIRLPSIPFISFKERRVVVRGMYYAYARAKELDLDIIHTHTEFGTGWLGKFISKRLEIPIVHTYHTMYEDYLHYIAHGKLLRPIHVKQIIRAYSYHISGLICPSQRVVDSLKGYDIYVPMQVIPTGVNMDKFQVGQNQKSIDLKENYQLPKDSIVLLSMSRLSFEKNIQTLIRGLPQVIEKRPEIRLLIAGCGPYEEKLLELVEELSLQEYVQFIGEIPNERVADYYRAAEYFVSASDSESQGLTYIESLASGTQAIVKGNEYIDSIFDDLSLGVTYQHNDDFSDTLLQYIDAVHEPNEQILQKKLYEISSENFAKRILSFYAQAQQYYLSMPFTQREQLPIRLFKKEFKVKDSDH